MVFWTSACTVPEPTRHPSSDVRFAADIKPDFFAPSSGPHGAHIVVAQPQGYRNGYRMGRLKQSLGAQAFERLIPVSTY
jgi:hypothetical protein